MTIAVSPLAPTAFPALPAVAGVGLATVAGGLRYRDRDDLFLAFVPEGSTVAGSLTTTKCPSAPVEWCRRHLAEGSARAIVVNSGNANAFTGRRGYDAVVTTAEAVGRALRVPPASVLLSSTGVIGEQLDAARLVACVPDLVGALAPSGPAAWQRAANAIRTTDTFAKGAWQSVSGTEAVVVGIAKGSGMIAPHMATMLAYVFTDAAVGLSTLQRLTSAAVAGSFNRITVDSDTSTSDTLLTVATGAAGVSIENGVDEAMLARALDAVMLELAHQIIRDGEGATKFVTVTVTGAESDDAAEAIARSIADSPLVKTALAAEDANWGRIVMAVGKSGEAADRDALEIRIGPELVATEGLVHPDYSEERATEHLRQSEVEIAVDVGVGAGTGTIWTCDLTHGYIDINAGYRS